MILSQGLAWNMAWYILFSFSLLFPSSVSHSASQRATSLFFPAIIELHNSVLMRTGTEYWPPDIEATFMKLVLARSKSFSLTQAWPCLYQAFSLLLSNSSTISANSLILSDLESGCCSRHMQRLLYTATYKLYKSRIFIGIWPDMFVWIHCCSSSASMCFLWPGSTEAIWRNAGVPCRSLSIPCNEQVNKVISSC